MSARDAEDPAAGKAAWEKEIVEPAIAKHAERAARFETTSGIEVEEGQPVKAGQGVIVVEAMKMENELKAPADGVVSKILVQERQTVEKGATLIVLA